MPSITITYEEPEIATQAEILRRQLLGMKEKGAVGSTLYERGVGRLEAIMWLIGNEHGPKNLMFSNSDIASNAAIWGLGL